MSQEEFINDLQLDQIKIERLRDIFHLVCAIFILFQLIWAEDCKIFRCLRNANVACDNQEFVTFNETVNGEVCVHLCDDRNCTAIAMKTSKATRWCCIFTSDNITYYHGNNLLYRSMLISVTRQEDSASNGNFSIHFFSSNFCYGKIFIVF